MSKFTVVPVAFAFGAVFTVWPTGFSGVVGQLWLLSFKLLFVHAAELVSLWITGKAFMCWTKLHRDECLLILCSYRRLSSDYGELVVDTFSGFTFSLWLHMGVTVAARCDGGYRGGMTAVPVNVCNFVFDDPVILFCVRPPGF